MPPLLKIELNNTGDGPLQAPGFNSVPLEFKLPSHREFASLHRVSWLPAPLTARELQMLKLMNSITERPRWNERVFEPSTLQTWRDEILPDFPLVSARAWDWCVAELRDKASESQENGGLVMVLNAGSGVCKSDTLIPDDVRAEIKDFVTVALEDIDNKGQNQPEHVRTLLDPSLYPLVRGHTRVLSGGGSVALEQTLNTYGQGEVAPVLDDTWVSSRRDRAYYSMRYQLLPCEVGFCAQGSDTAAVRITSYVNNLHPRDHRPFYRTLEQMISKAIEPWNKTLIRRDRYVRTRYRHTVGRQPPRIRTYGVDWTRGNPYPDWAAELPATLDVDTSTAEYKGALARVKEYLALPEAGLKVSWWFNKTRELPDDWETSISLREAVDIKYSRLFRFEHSDPGTTYSYEDWKAGRTAQAIVSREDYENCDPDTDLWEKRWETTDLALQQEMIRAQEDWDHEFQTVKLQDEFRHAGLQVCVQIRAIELTPETPFFAGEDWHAAGMLNEHIVGVAIYAFDMENITTPRLSFSQMVFMNGDEFAFDADGWDIPYVEKLFGVKNNGSPLQEIGSVSVVPGRLLAFPNCLRHRLEPFQLADKTRPGHCRFLTLWLVDPYVRICSTRNVPPQRRDWWEQEVRSQLAEVHPLPCELVDQIVADTGPWLMDLGEAERQRRGRAEEEALALELDKKAIKREAIRLYKLF
ncbi:DUF4246 domain-containing protein [Aspergillus mulundensis]|uniref:Uncharacterized protein n=1 Tax=Aspergillus mulundensis TaxID=1810919 RepID=A0A3D8T549_9EURO|nr:Uncharacterized protein DSM5745_01008 [Aspergillus mulundensis]RDW93686.1 Uncharacterized protein DSM5745_01008 [Aspergillus mulundensis]